MNAMIFAAGLGTRLAPLTDNCPKALIEVGGRPMLARAIDNVREAGATKVVVNVHHHADMIKAYLAKNDFGVETVISDESGELLDTGGGVVKARSLLIDSEPIILYNADIYTDLSLREMVDAHIAGGVDATLLVAERDTSRYLLFENAGRMTGWANKTTGEVRSPYPNVSLSTYRALAFGGIHILSPTVINDMANYCPEGKFSVTSYYIDRCGLFDFHAFMPCHDYRWIDIGKHQTLEQARKIADGERR